MIEKIKRLFQKHLQVKVVIGSKTLRIAEPLASRYYDLTELLTIPRFDSVAKIQNELDKLVGEFAKANTDEEREAIRKKMSELQQATQTELTSHTQAISALFEKRDYDTLKRIVQCVCVGDVDVEDIKNCYEIEVKIAVDFFLALHFKTSRDIVQSYSNFVASAMTSTRA